MVALVVADGDSPPLSTVKMAGGFGWFSLGTVGTVPGGGIGR